MRRLILLAAVLAALSAPAMAEDDSGTVTNVSTDGDVMTLSSGHSWQTTDGSDLTSWLGDDVTVGGGTALDTDSGDTADVEEYD